MKVVHVSPMFFGEESYVGGGERYALELARAMAAMVPTTLVSFGARRRSLRLDELALEIFPARWPRGRLDQPLNVHFLASLLPADVIHCHHIGTSSTTLSLLAGRMLGKTRVATPLGLHAKKVQDRLTRIAGVSKLLCISEFSARAVPYRAPIRVIYGGVDLDRFSAAGAVKERKIVYVGRLLPHKGVNYLIEALDPDMRLEVYGTPYDQRYYQDLRDLARGKDVRFIPHAADEDIARAYATALVSVLPSVHVDMYGQSYPEPELLGLVLLEAMAAGTAVVGTRVASIPELIEDGVTGLLVPPNDPRGLRDALRRLYDQPEEANRLGRQGCAMVHERFTWNSVARRCLDAYR